MITYAELRARLTIGDLRERAPSWTWTAERRGLGWEYVGRMGARTVRVYAVAVLSGYTDDDCSTEWRVNDGHRSVSFIFWDRGVSK